jgi:hypothetical protein
MAETDRLSLYPTVELKERLVAIADREHRTLNAQGILLLEAAVDAYEVSNSVPVQAPSLRSIAVNGDTTVDMVTGAEVDPMTLEPKPVRRRGRRSEMCEHRVRASAHCSRCDDA